MSDKKPRTLISFDRFNLVKSLQGKVSDSVIMQASNLSHATVGRMKKATDYEDYKRLIKENNQKAYDARLKTTVFKEKTLPQGVALKSNSLEELPTMTNLSLLNSILAELKKMNSRLEKKKFIF